MVKRKLNKPVKAKKSYDNPKFLHSTEGRVVRMLTEYLHPKQQFVKKKVYKTIIFFGSARIQSKEFYKNRTKVLSDGIVQFSGDEKEKLVTELEHIKKKNITKMQGGLVI